MIDGRVSTHRILLVAALLFAAALRLPLLGATDLWNDESYMAIFCASDRPWEHLVAVEHSPPLYFLILRVWTSIVGITETTLRIPSAFGGLAAVAAAYGLARFLATPRAGLFAALLAACAAHATVHSREARGYILLAAPYLLCLLGAARCAEGPSRRGWLAFVGGGTIVSFLHYAAIPFVGLAALATLWTAPASRRTEILRGLGVWLLAGAFLYAPWLPSMRRQLGPDSFFADAVAPGSSQGVKDGLYALVRIPAWTFGYNLPSEAFRLFYGPLAALAAAVLLGDAAFGSRMPRLRVVRIAGIGGILLAGTLYGAGLAREMVYLLFLEATVLVLAAVALDRWGRSGVVFTLLLASLGLFGVGEAFANRFHLEDRLTRVAWRETASEIRAGIGPGEVVAVPNGWASSLGWYLRDASDSALYQFTRDAPYFHRAASCARFVPVTREGMIENLPADRRGVWWIEHAAELADPGGAVRRTLAASATDSRLVRAAAPRVTYFRF